MLPLRGASITAPKAPGFCFCAAEFRSTTSFGGAHENPRRPWTENFPRLPVCRGSEFVERDREREQVREEDGVITLAGILAQLQPVFQT